MFGDVTIYYAFQLHDSIAHIQSGDTLDKPLPHPKALGTTTGGFLYEKIGFLLITELQVAVLLLYSAAMILFVLTYGRKVATRPGN